MTDQYGDAYESDADVVWTCTSGDGVIDGTTFSVENSGYLYVDRHGGWCYFQRNDRGSAQ